MVLSQLQDVAVPVLERRWFRDLAADTGPEGKLRRLARQSRVVKDRSGDLMRVIEGAAGVDQQIAALWSDIESKLLQVQGEVVAQLDDQEPCGTTSTCRPPSTSCGPSTIPASGT